MPAQDPSAAPPAPSAQEQKLYSSCRDVDSGQALFNPPQSVALLTLAEQVWARAHHPEIKNLRKSAELTRLLRLLGSSALYPHYQGDQLPSFLMRERVVFLGEVMGLSGQRPVCEAAALALLELVGELDALDEGLLEQLCQRSLDAQVQTLPTLALFGMLRPEQGSQRLRSRLNQLSFDERRQRLLELVSLLEDGLSLDGAERLARQTFEALFLGLNSEQRGQLIERLLREIEQRHKLKSLEHLSPLLTPLFAQNMRHADLQERILALIFARQERIPAFDPVLTLYVRQSDSRLWPDPLWGWLREHGGRAVVPTLYAMGHEELGVLAPLWRRRQRQRAQEALEVILARERLDGVGGALSVSAEDEHAGGLSVVASTGALSLGGDPTHNGEHGGGALIITEQPASGFWGRAVAFWRRLWRRFGRRS